jgi:hypothetical protein
LLAPGGARMMHFLEKARRFLWLFVELGFLTILSVILIYLILGDNSGVFVTSVADNVKTFAADVPTPSLIGIGVIVAIIYLVMQRIR